MQYKSLLSLLALAGCMSADPDYYTLFPLQSAASAEASFASLHTTVKIQRPGLSALLDRPEMVRMDGQSHIERDTAHLWAEPLDKMTERVLALDLGGKLPASSVITQSGSMETEYNYRVEWELQRFGTDSNGHAVLAAQLLVTSANDAATPEPVLLQGDKAQSGKALAEALSQLLSQLSDKIASEIQAKAATHAFTPGGPAAAPSVRPVVPTPLIVEKL